MFLCANIPLENIPLSPSLFRSWYSARPIVKNIASDMRKWQIHPERNRLGGQVICGVATMTMMNQHVSHHHSGSDAIFILCISLCKLSGSSNFLVCRVLHSRIFALLCCVNFCFFESSGGILYDEMEQKIFHEMTHKLSGRIIPSVLGRVEDVTLIVSTGTHSGIDPIV